VGQAKGGFDTVRKGVATGADSIGQRIRSGPAQVQSVLSTLQKRIEEQRLLMALKVHLNTVQGCAADVTLPL
jgi:hypothetical protein